MDIIEKYIQAATEQARLKHTEDKTTAERDLLLSLDGATDITELDFLKLIHICLNTPSQQINVLGWGQIERLKSTIHDNYLLDIDYTDKPIVKESYWAWLNLDTDELTANKPFEAMIAGQDIVRLPDYRPIGIGWRELVERLKKG